MLQLPSLLHLPPEIHEAERAEFEDCFQRMDIDNNREIDLQEFKLFCGEVRMKSLRDSLR